MWRNSPSEINDELFKGYMKGNPEKKTDEIAAGCLLFFVCYFSTPSCKYQLLFLTKLYDLLLFAAYDFLNTNKNRFNVSIWYNATYKYGGRSEQLVRVPPMVNVVNHLLFSYMLFLSLSTIVNMLST